jgi:hypothetical protein
MEKNLPLSIIPDQFFPDVELTKVALTSTELVVTASDSEWGLQSDITFFHGPGEMHFHYEGPVRMHWKKIEDVSWNPGSLDLIPSFTNFDMIHQKDGMWFFRFRAATRGLHVEIFFEKIKSIGWTGEGDADIEGEE